ncbi:MAG: hypothetical protein HRU19_09815 [Pseudobacteriovorax sp.]|nr:hypothetical protein [Pseudobacteriovorax sp.]
MRILISLSLLSFATIGLANGETGVLNKIAPIELAAEEVTRSHQVAFCHDLVDEVSVDLEHGFIIEYSDAEGRIQEISPKQSVEEKECSLRQLFFSCLSQ